MPSISLFFVEQHSNTRNENTDALNALLTSCHPCFITFNSQSEILKGEEEEELFRTAHRVPHSLSGDGAKRMGYDAFFRLPKSVLSRIDIAFSEMVEEILRLREKSFFVLLVDELMKTKEPWNECVDLVRERKWNEEGYEARQSVRAPRAILKGIGRVVNSIPNFNCVVSSLVTSPLDLSEAFFQKKW